MNWWWLVTLYGVGCAGSSADRGSGTVDGQGRPPQDVFEALLEAGGDGRESDLRADIQATESLPLPDCDCCRTDADCDDGHPRTEDASHADADGDDGHPRTEDASHRGECLDPMDAVCLQQLCADLSAEYESLLAQALPCVKHADCVLPVPDAVPCGCTMRVSATADDATLLAMAAQSEAWGCDQACEPCPEGPPVSVCLDGLCTPNHAVTCDVLQSMIVELEQEIHSATEASACQQHADCHQCYRVVWGCPHYAWAHVGIDVSEMNFLHAAIAPPTCGEWNCPTVQVHPAPCCVEGSCNYEAAGSCECEAVCGCEPWCQSVCGR